MLSSAHGGVPNRGTPRRFCQLSRREVDRRLPVPGPDHRTASTGRQGLRRWAGLIPVWNQVAARRPLVGHTGHPSVGGRGPRTASLCVETANLSTVVRDAEASAPGRIRGTGSMRRRVLGLAWPVIGENLLQTLLGIVDTLLVARLGAEAIAGVGSSLQIMFLAIGVLSAVSVGSSILVAQAIGARDRRHANALAKQALVWGAVLGVPLSIGGWALAESIAHWLGLPPEVAAITTAYLRVILGGGEFLVLMYVAGAVLRGAGDSRTPMLASLVANLINASLAFLLIFGHLGLPALGAQGSAGAPLIGRGGATLPLSAALACGGGGAPTW